MTTAQLKQGIQRARQELETALQTEGAKIGLDVAALVENRIVSKGEKRDGSKFSPYSNKPVPAYLYFGRSRNAGGEARTRKAAKDKQGISYRQFREFNGLNTNIKNFQFTGEMWQGFGVKSVRFIRRGVVEIVIGGTNARSTLLLDAHSTRENTELTAPSDKEIQQVVRAIEGRVLTIIQRNL